MTKKFFEVFPSLQLNQKLKSEFEDVDVIRLAYNRENTEMRVYLDAGHLLQKEPVYFVERQITKQLLKGSGMRAVIRERFHLSARCDVRYVMEQYRSSILLELEHYDHFLQHTLLHASLDYPEADIIKLTLQDTVVARAKEHELLHVLDAILNERCGVGAKFTITYCEAKESGAREEDERKLREEIRRITQKAEQVNAGASVTSETRQTVWKSAAQSVSEAGSGSLSTAQKQGRNLTGSLQRAGANTDPNLIYGREFSESPIPISDIIEEIGEVVVTGQVIRLDIREMRNDRKLLIFDLTDDTDTITVKVFPRENRQEILFENVAVGAFLTLKATPTVDQYDRELTLGYVSGIRKAEDFRTVRDDHAAVKRVELHCHTKMSDMDAVSDVAAIMKRAADWGQTALAITDHGIVQAFTDAFHALPAIRKSHPEFKLIYGCEGYLVDDLAKIVIQPRDYPLNGDYVALSLKTTGTSASRDQIIEAAALRIIGGKVENTFSSLVNPRRPIPYSVEKAFGINDQMVADAPYLNEVLPELLDFIGELPIVAHDADLCESFLRVQSEQLGIQRTDTYVDTAGLARMLLTNIKKFTLEHVCKVMKLNYGGHRAAQEATACAHVFLKAVPMLAKREQFNLLTLNEAGRTSVEKIKQSRMYHVILLAKNEIGRINLYRLISLSHLTYFHSRPRIPKSVLSQFREGLIIGSACEQGEVFRAVLEEKSEADVAKIVNFYDYLEVQPLGNNAFLKRAAEYPQVETDEDLQLLNKKIIRLGTEYGKPVVATCDTHFMNPQDEIYRRVIQAGKGYKDADEQPPLYLRTTEEMMEEFSYLPYEKAYEIVVTNTNMIADMVDYIEPVRPDKCPPVIEDSAAMLREICYRKANEIYGSPLPEPVHTRLERELTSIISNGFAVMYIIAQKLVWKSLEDGYLVGSRGSVGSSFVATMAGITEVNPLAPHYYCPHCHYSDFASDAVKAYAGKAGCDMPDRNCPECGERLKKDGFDIPFETFLGFEGNKEPDIDLNFSGEYQANAHRYTEVIFGKGQTFKAGTIGTLADKTAFGYVKNYFEERQIQKRSCEIGRISAGCTGIRRTTGQHPGGIIVLPHGEDINSFTPIQHPANDMSTDIVTTHFDYHSIDHNLLKLDILGHDDPTMIRRLEDLTQTDPRNVPLDDAGVMSLFRSTEALHVTPDDLGGCPLGSLGIPEFGTDFAMQMLLDTKPTSFSDLVRIAGLAHGTDVWLGNAQELIRKGTATISTAICTRDDIMTYLISMGMQSSLAFQIMERVRKGDIAKGKVEKWQEWRQEMTDHGVPDWYIWSCEKIKYMFPKAHAAAYVMMAWRIAYYKIYYPLEYYAAYLSIRATAFHYEKMCLGKSRLKSYLEEYRKNADHLSNKEQEELKDMRVVEEMYARGFEFLPIDIFRAKAHACQVIDGKIMPHIGSVEGLGDKAADAVVQAAKQGAFLSRDDFRERTKLSKTAVEKMASLGLLGDIPESNQLSLFDQAAFA